MANCHLNIRRFALGAVLLALAVVTPACGGSGGGPGPDGAGQGLVLISFLQAGVDNVPLNEVLQLQFSEAVNAASITPASIQIREGNAFGATVAGTFEVQGSVVLFRPQLPSLCDLSDAGFKASTQYRVQVIGWPEEFAVQNTAGQKLNQTTTWEFSTRDDQDPQKFTDAIPAAAPTVVTTSPLNGEAAVSVGSAANRQRIVLTMTENLDPCTVSADTVSIEVYEQGNPGVFTPAPGGRNSGFDDGGGDVTDQNPADVTTWGSNGTPWPGGAQALPATIHLIQDFNQTQIVISPLFGQDPATPELGGQFPDNVLIVVRLAFGIEDFGGQPLSPYAMSFTTENTNAEAGTYTIEAEGETPFDSNNTTADINTARAPSLIQGYLLFAGDGDNGSVLTQPTLPETVGSGCTVPNQINDGAKDPLDPAVNTVLDTGAENTCINVTDGSTAVIWEFLSLRIRSGVQVRIVGSNPAILLVQGDALVEANASIRVTGDGVGGTPNSAGGNGNNTNSSGLPVARAGGTGVAGGGDGGDAKAIAAGNANPGHSGYGSPSGYQTSDGTGAGKGGRNSLRSSFATAGGGSAGGGGGGHSVAGANGVVPTQPAPVVFTGVGTGFGGGTYPAGANASLLLTPSAGSGGGSAGYHDHNTSFGGYKSTGGAGGAGGGFLDITASGDISVFGTITAAGGRGGSGAGASFYTASGGGGGGSGGGIRLLTPNDINIAGGTITAAGGAGGAGATGTGGGNPSGAGGNGGIGRIAMEDSDSVIAGFAAAITIPTDGDDGFHRGVFDATRFQGGGLTPEALTEIIFMGPLEPQYSNPVQGDFVAGAPSIGSPGVGSMVIQIEARGYQIQPDGNPDLASETPWQVVGDFTDSGNESLPDYNPGAGLVGLSGYEYLQFRFTIFLDSSVGPFDPGAFIDTWTVHFSSNN
ncbi:MAG: Ig-like domain-containing protein [Planctomycetota bacterium]|nr:Ig-like domain-containing protein [Planctomycetota bacterium]